VESDGEDLAGEEAENKLRSKAVTVMTRPPDCPPNRTLATTPGPELMKRVFDVAVSGFTDRDYFRLQSGIVVRFGAQ
jgi:hypothetical protein